MKLKSVLQTLDGLEAAVQAFYTEKDGVFYLNVEGVAEHPDVKAQSAALIAVRKEKKTAETALAAANKIIESLPEDFDPEAYQALIDGGAKVDERLTAQAARLKKEKDVAVSKVEGERDGFKAKLQKTVADSALNQALQESNVSPEMQKAVRAMFNPQVKVEFEGDEPVVTIDDLPVVEKIKAWAATDEGKYFVKAPENSGGGARPNGPGGKQTDYTKLSMTDLMVLNGKNDKAAESELNRRNSLPIKQGINIKQDA